jgi:hypothetical protein
MTDCNDNGRECDRWIMLDHDGKRTLYRLVEVGKETDILRLAGELPAPAVIVEMALPVLPALDETPGKSPRSASSRLILLNVRTATGDDADGAVDRRFVRERPKSMAGKRELAPRLVRMPDAASRTERTRVTDTAADRNQG